MTRIDRRQFLAATLGGLVAARRALGAPVLFEKNNGLANERICKGALFQFPRTGGFKWGGRLKVQDIGILSDMQYWILTVENEEYPDCPAGPDTAHQLTTLMNFNGDNGRWIRDERTSDLVDSVMHMNFMRCYLRARPDLEINNLAAPELAPIPMVPKTEQQVQLSYFNLAPSDLVTVPASQLRLQLEQAQMHRFIHCESDPWAIMDIYQVGIGTDQKGLYGMDVYHAFPDRNNRLSVESEVKRALGMTFDYGSGSMDVVEERTDRSAPPTSVFASPGFDKNGRWLRLYKVDNRDNRHSQAPMPQLVGNDPGPSRPPDPGAQPQPTADTLDVKCYQYEGADKMCTTESDDKGKSLRNIVFRDPGTARIRLYSQDPGYQMILDNPQESGSMMICVDQHCVGPKGAFTEWGK